MVEENRQVGGSWEDLTIPDSNPEPYVQDGAELNERAGEESAKEKAVKCSPNLLQMLKAAERRRSTPGRDRDKADGSEAGTKELITEALKTNMVSKDMV